MGMKITLELDDLTATRNQCARRAGRLRQRARKASREGRSPMSARLLVESAYWRGCANAVQSVIASGTREP